LTTNQTPVIRTFKVYNVVSAEEAEQINQARAILSLVTLLKLRNIVAKMLTGHTIEEVHNLEEFYLTHK